MALPRWLPLGVVLWTGAALSEEPADDAVVSESRFEDLLESGADEAPCVVGLGVGEHLGDRALLDVAAVFQMPLAARLRAVGERRGDGVLIVSVEGEP